MGVKVLDAGNKLMLSGDLRVEVQVELDEWLARGAKLISSVNCVGTNWVAACTIPPNVAGPETTNTLQLQDIATHAQKSAMEPEHDDGCRVEELGFKRLITGPSAVAVNLRIEHMKQFGIQVVSGPEKQNGEWVALVDTGGADKAFRW